MGATADGAGLTRNKGDVNQCHKEKIMEELKLKTEKVGREGRGKDPV